MLHIVLVAPEIPHNAGAAGRLALATGARLHLVKPLGFSLDDKHVRRTGLDYWKDVDLHVWEDFPSLLQSADSSSRFWFLSTKATRSHWEAGFEEGDYLVFGCESRGLPEPMIQAAGMQALRIPMAQESTRSLNLSTAIAITLYEAVRQTGGM
ncbi:tRNA (cytidine/uridine-2'-O-)-methyltransferase [Haloferula luteola]|uniref:Putative tRNA (cytidine(34)-2'-O)-methyltransferase n=1 Tax=Haloferula luteola TaxID=595692 RepID=A0A840VFD2_9BACT|nr:tRNA (cytidine(34)-2'-O)-methyltransferase [Haloferula luteola]MBB5352529.1 tRNA (cytidine/uridine-2'-O-)-methyltransferase [Haloferula luteola]